MPSGRGCVVYDRREDGISYRIGKAAIANADGLLDELLQTLLGFAPARRYGISLRHGLVLCGQVASADSIKSMSVRSCTKRDPFAYLISGVKLPFSAEVLSVRPDLSGVEFAIRPRQMRPVLTELGRTTSTYRLNEAI